MNEQTRQGTHRDPDDDDWDSPYVQQEDPMPSVDSREQLRPNVQEMFRDEEEDEEDGFDMSVAELLYSTSSFYAIAIPGTHWTFSFGLRRPTQNPQTTHLVFQ